MIIPNIWENKKCSKPPTSVVIDWPEMRNDSSYNHCSDVPRCQNAAKAAQIPEATAHQPRISLSFAEFLFGKETLK